MKISDNIKQLHTSDSEKDSLQKVIAAIDKKLTSSAPKKQSNLLDWSLHDSYVNNVPEETAGRQSFVVKQSVDDDVLRILKNSDETTWYTLDLIMKKLGENNEKLDSLLHFNETQRELEQNNAEANILPSLQSPLVEAIRETSNESLSLVSNTTNSSVDSVDTSSHTRRTESEALDAMINLESQGDMSDLIGNGFVDLPLNNSFNFQSIGVSQNSIAPLNTPNSPVIAHPSPRSTHPKHEFHLSNLERNTSRQDVIEYMQRRGVPISLMEEVKVKLLVPKDRDRNTLSFISAKIDTNPEVASIITRLNFWPPTCTLKSFIHKPKPVTDLTTITSSLNNRDFPNVGQSNALYRANPYTFSTQSA